MDTKSVNAGIKVDLLWFEGCPNHSTAQQLLQETLNEFGIEQAINMIDVTDPEMGEKTRFPGSPTIRINGKDIDPTYEDTGDYTPRCRVYFTSDGLRGIPEKTWIAEAISKAMAG